MKRCQLLLFFFIGFLPFICWAVSNDTFFELQRDQRQNKCHTAKEAVSNFDIKKPWPYQSNNGDQALYSNLRGNFGKALNHFSNGYLNPAAYDSLVKAMQSGVVADFNAIQIGTGTVKLVNPQGAFAFTLTGIDGWINRIPPAPTFASAETAGEMVEVYWTALCRDVNFNDFGTDPIVASAVADLNSLSDFKGPVVGGVVTPGTFLRGNTPGDLIGPYI